MSIFSHKRVGMMYHEIVMYAAEAEDWKRTMFFSSLPSEFWFSDNKIYFTPDVCASFNTRFFK